MLHIEDDPRNRLLVRKLLAAEGHEIIDAEDGLQGLRLARSVAPELILIDLNIPSLDGYEVALRLRSDDALARVPIVAITAEGDRETSLVVGCDGFIQKPIDARNFAATVKSYLSGYKEKPSNAGSNDRMRVQSGRMVLHLEEKVAELMAANERLREVEHLRREFYRSVSHELATPMTPIVGYLRMLLDEELGPVSKAQTKALHAMDDCVKRLRNTLDSLVDVTGLETGKITFFHRNYDFGALVSRTLEGLSEVFSERRVTVLREIPAGLMPGMGDAERLQRALAHVLDNAAKFTPEGGVVGVCVRVLDRTYEVTVIDSGAGVPSEIADRIFEPFVQGDGSATRPHGGVGVGLAIARKVARGLGGDLVLSAPTEVQGQQLRGSAFTLTVAKWAAPKPA